MKSDALGNPFKALFTARIPESELEIDFVRSGGPGGQNVNKTSTKAQLRWNVAASTAFTEREKALIERRLSRRMTKEGTLILSSERERSQLQNKEAVIERLQSLVHEALKPQTKRVATKPTRGSKERRLKAKKERSQKKQARREPIE